MELARRNLIILSAIAMWEYFSFYGMRALLVLYMTKVLLFSDYKSYSVYGAYGTFVYITPFIGVMLAERCIGLYSSVMLGGILMALGHFLLVFFDQSYFFSALSLIIIGNGLIKPNLVKSVGDLFPLYSADRNAAFTFYYVGANFGSFLSPILCGIVAAMFGWVWGFLLAGVGMVLGLMLYAFYYARFVDDLTRLRSFKQNISLGFVIITGVAAFDYFIKKLFEINAYSIVSNAMLVVMSVLLVVILIKSDKKTRKNMLYMSILFFFGTLFWALNQQAGSSITIYTDRLVDRHFLGWEIPTAFFQSVNPIVILACGPVLGMLWRYMDYKNKNPSYMTKFTLSILLIGLGFGVLALSTNLSFHQIKISWLWLIFAYFVMTIGELCCEPICFEACNTIPKSNLIGLMIGFWYLCTGSYANYLASIIAEFTSVDTNKVTSLIIADYKLFNNIFVLSSLLSLCLAIILMIWFYLKRKSKLNLPEKYLVIEVS